jgi:hypothetical protein
MDIRLGALPVALFVFTGSEAWDFEDRRQYITPTRVAIAAQNDNAKAGRGWLTFGEFSKTACVQAKITPKVVNGLVSHIFFVETQREFERVLTVSASAGAQFAGGSGNASYNMTSELKTTDTTALLAGFQRYIQRYDLATDNSKADDGETLSALFLAYQEHPLDVPGGEISDLLSTVRLKDEYVKLLSTEAGREEFLEKCGDSYITAAAIGAEQIVAFELLTASREAKRKETQTYGAGTSLGSAANFSRTEQIRRFDSANKLKITLAQSGASADTNPLTLAQAQEFLQNFHKNAAENNSTSNTVLLVTLNRYDMVSNWPEDLEIPQNWSNGVFLASALSTLRQLRDEIRSVLANQNAYILDASISERSMLQAITSLDNEISRVSAAQSNCMRAPARCDLAGAWTDDYEVRSSLPALKDDVPAWAVWQKGTKRLNKLLKEYRRYVGVKPSKINFTAKNDCRGALSGACKALLKRLLEQRKRVEQQRATMAAQAAQTRIQYWVGRVDDGRCNDHDQRQWGCVGVAKVEGYLSKALDQPPPPIPRSPFNSIFRIAPTDSGITDREVDAAWATLEAETGPSETVTVDCRCKTWKNPSWCGTNLGDPWWEEWTRYPFKPEKGWEDGFLNEYCQRHAVDECLCPDLKYFEGRERN